MCLSCSLLDQFDTVVYDTYITLHYLIVLWYSHTHPFGGVLGGHTHDPHASAFFLIICGLCVWACTIYAPSLSQGRVCSWLTLAHFFKVVYMTYIALPNSSRVFTNIHAHACMRFFLDSVGGPWPNFQGQQSFTDLMLGLYPYFKVI